jgi:hypothetical protein
VAETVYCSLEEPLPGNVESFEGTWADTIPAGSQFGQISLQTYSHTELATGTTVSLDCTDQTPQTSSTVEGSVALTPIDSESL